MALRFASASSGERRRERPSMLALTTFPGFREPSDLVTASFTPASSSTARTPPPTMSPVPGAAGLISTREALKRASTGCGMVVPTMGTLSMCLRATVVAMRIASGTSLAFPIAAPTCPLPSPTTTTAVKWKRRPPFITLATRLMKTTFSESSISEESTFPRLPMYLPGFDMITSSEGEASLAGCLRQRLDATVVPEAAAVEDDGLDPLLGGLAGERFAHQLGDLCLLLTVALAAQAGLHVGRGHQRTAAAIVYHLNVDMAQAAEHRQPRPLRRAGDALAHADVAPYASCVCGLGPVHASAPPYRPCRPCGVRTRPDSGSLCPCRAPAASPCGRPPPSFPPPPSF